jgi:hypothetical protein
MWMSSITKIESIGSLGSQTLRQILDHYIKPLNIPAWSGAMIWPQSKPAKMVVMI